MTRTSTAHGTPSKRQPRGKKAQGKTTRRMNSQPAATTAGLIVGDRTLLSQFEYKGPVLIGNDCYLKRSRVGRYFACGSWCRIIDADVGSFCSFGDNVQVNGGRHPKGWVSTHLFRSNPRAWDWYDQDLRDGAGALPYKWREPISIGHDVWIGSNVVIRTGVKIASGAIIGANSVVTSDVPPYAVIAGAPAVVRSYRFDEATIVRLVAVQWWHRPIEILFRLPFDDVQATLALLEAGA